MKLKYYFLILSMVFVCLMNSCTDVLNIAPDGNLSMEDVLSDPNKVGALLNTCYNNIPPRGYTYSFFDPLIVACSDDAWSSEDGVGTPVSEFYRGRATASNHPFIQGRDGDTGGTNLHPWRRNWQQIRLCSQFIELADKAAVDRESDRARFVAEAHLLRAYFYSELVKWFGRLPIMEESVPFDTDFSSFTRASVYDVANFIIKDCDVALNTPEIPWRIVIEADALRVTKALAWALKTKMMLFAASPLHNNGNDYWEEAYQISKQAVSELRANGYKLFTQCTNEALFGTYGAQAYHQLFCQNADYSATPRDCETIWQHKTGALFIWHIGYIGSDMSNTYKVGSCPTQELIDAYETTDGKPVLNLSQPYLDENHLQPNYNTGNTMYNRNDPYVNRDPRLYATAMMNGSIIRWDNEDVVVETFTGGRHQPSFDQNNRSFTRTGYFQRKMTTPGACGVNQINNANTKFYRFGELLLDFAEAACEANHFDEAKAAVDEIRARVSMPPLPSGLSKDELRLRIHNERRVELAWEEQRYFDLRRWQKPNGDLSATCKWLTAMIITKNADGSFTYERRNPQPTARFGWENKDLLLPIPLDEVSRLEPVTGEKWQNPSW